MSLLPPLPIMEKWRLEGLSPQEVKARADAWVRDARPALSQPVLPKPKPKESRVNLKLPDQEHLEELYKDYSLREIGAMYGATAEAVRHHLKKTGAIERKQERKQAERLKKIETMKKEGASWAAIAAALGVGVDHCREVAKRAGILEEKPRFFGCPKCDEYPYAKGLCRHCYEWVRRNKGKLSPEEEAKVRERASLSQGPGKYHRGLRPETIERARRIKALREKGLTFKQIQAETGIYSSTACRSLKLYENYLKTVARSQD